jgi:adenylosuccinate synthase
VVHPENSLVAISGPVCAGKSTLAAGLGFATGARILTTRLLISDHLGYGADELSRGELQKAGDVLDEERGGAWVAEGVEALVGNAGTLIVVDAVRNFGQLVALREERLMSHIHLTADPDVLANRYAERSRNNPQLEFADLQSLRANPTEANVETLARFADLELDTGATEADAILRAVMDILQQDL